MIYLKSAIVELLAEFLAAVAVVVLAVAGTIIYSMVQAPSREGAIGWDPISLVKVNWQIWIVAVLVFLAGFFWEYRRLKKS